MMQIFSNIISPSILLVRYLSMLSVDSLVNLSWPILVRNQFFNLRIAEKVCVEEEIGIVITT
jgi:hypothetical protein